MLISRAQWYIESFLSEDLTLEQIAADCKVSPFHLSRTFTVLTGASVMRYVWKRRLTRAAEHLAAGAESILNVALDAGYASHEAFSRAFKAEFSLTPKALDPGQLATLPLTQPTFMSRKAMPKTMNPPVIETMPDRLFVGPSKRYDMQTRSAIPAQWAAYNEADQVPEHVIPDNWYGLCYDFADEGEFSYLCGMEVTKRGSVPSGQTLVTLPAGRYARFASKRHISQMGDIWGEIYAEWLGTEGLTARPGASVEYYPLEFDGRTGEGGFEIWIAVA
jgi:AraC family transcriptional regulator